MAAAPPSVRRWLPLLPGLALLLVAAVQIALARRAMLSPWKGGGFGMFSSLDARPFRYVRLVVEAPGRSEELAVPARLEALAASAEVLPTDHRLEALARAVVAHERARGRPADSVTIDVWRAEYEPADLRPTARRLRGYAWPAPR